MSRIRRRYPSDCTDLQWEIIKTFLPKASPGGRRRKYQSRRIINAIFYINRTGCSWRHLPDHFPHWRTVYGYFVDWTESGIIHKIHNDLIPSVRLKENRDPSPSVLIVDAQSIKNQFGKSRGYDGFKKIRGRKRNIFVDTLGLIQRS